MKRQICFSLWKNAQTIWVNIIFQCFGLCLIKDYIWVCSVKAVESFQRNFSFKKVLLVYDQLIQDAHFILISELVYVWTGFVKSLLYGFKLLLQTIACDKTGDEDLEKLTLAVIGDTSHLYVIFSLQFLPARNHGNCELRRVEDLKCCTDSSIYSACVDMTSGDWKTAENGRVWKKGASFGLWETCEVPEPVSK